MPTELENKLKKRAVKKFKGDKKKQGAYVYGGMRNAIGWKPSTQNK